MHSILAADHQLIISDGPMLSPGCHSASQTQLTSTQGNWEPLDANMIMIRLYAYFWQCDQLKGYLGAYF